MRILKLPDEIESLLRLGKRHNSLKIIENRQCSTWNEPGWRAVPDRTSDALETLSLLVDWGVFGQVDPKLIHLEFEHATRDAEGVRRACLIPMMTLERFAQDVGLESNDCFIEASLTLAPLFSKGLGLPRSAH